MGWRGAARSGWGRGSAAWVGTGGSADAGRMVVSSDGVAWFVGGGARPAAAELGGLVAVSADHCDAAIPGGGQVHASLADQIGNHVDSHDGLLIPDDARDQGCVITGATTDLQYAMPRGEPELAQ